MEFVECVSFILIHDGRVLLEKRRDDKAFDAGMVMVPGGHAEYGEEHLQTLARELMEELSLEAESAGYVCSLIHTAESEHETEVQRLHYYLVTEWQGDIDALEAEFVFWQPLTELDVLEIQPDRIAIAEAQRLYLS